MSRVKELDIELATRLYRDEGLGVRSISKRFGISPPHVAKQLREPCPVAMDQRVSAPVSDGFSRCPGSLSKFDKVGTSALNECAGFRHARAAGAWFPHLLRRQPVFVPAQRELSVPH